jgi:hypothetical protein
LHSRQASADIHEAEEFPYETHAKSGFSIFYLPFSILFSVSWPEDKWRFHYLFPVWMLRLTLEVRLGPLTTTGCGPMPRTGKGTAAARTLIFTGSFGSGVFSRTIQGGSKTHTLEQA